LEEATDRTRPVRTVRLTATRQRSTARFDGRAALRSRPPSCGRGEDVPTAPDDARKTVEVGSAVMSGPFRAVVRLPIRNSTPDRAPFFRPVSPHVASVELDDVK
jgi:hypothetical protein